MRSHTTCAKKKYPSLIGNNKLYTGLILNIYDLTFSRNLKLDSMIFRKFIGILFYRTISELLKHFRSFLHSDKNLRCELRSTLLSNYDHTTLQGRFQEKRDYTTTPWLHETKRGQCKKKLYAKNRRGNQNIDEQHTSK